MKDVQIAMTIIKQYIIIPSLCSLKYILPISPAFFTFIFSAFLTFSDSGISDAVECLFNRVTKQIKT